MNAILPGLEVLPQFEGHSLLGSYVIYDELGRGGLGVVLRAVHCTFEKDYALKLLIGDNEKDGKGGGPPEFRSDAIDRWRREATIGNDLHHPNLIRVEDAGLYSGRPYLVMEFVSGLTLGELVDAYRRAGHDGVPIPLALELIRQGLAGVAAAHRCTDDDGNPRCVVHRDIKPDNLMLDRKGVVRVLDLGLAKANAELRDGTEGAAIAATLDQQILGTPNYMAPEQWQDSRSAGPAVDVWAFGATLYSLISGRVPFEDHRSWTTILDEVTQRGFTPLEAWRDRVPPSLFQFMRQCLDSDPDRRFHDAREALDALEALGLHEPTIPDEVRAILEEARQPTDGRPSSELLRRVESFLSDNPDHRMVGGTMVQPDSDALSAPVPVPPPVRRRSRWGIAVTLIVLLSLGGWAGYSSYRSGRDLVERAQGAADLGERYRCLQNARNVEPLGLSGWRDQLAAIERQLETMLPEALGGRVRYEGTHEIPLAPGTAPPVLAVDESTGAFLPIPLSFAVDPEPGLPAIRSLTVQVGSSREELTADDAGRFVADRFSIPLGQQTIEAEVQLECGWTGQLVCHLTGVGLPSDLRQLFEEWEPERWTAGEGWLPCLHAPYRGLTRAVVTEELSETERRVTARFVGGHRREHRYPVESTNSVAKAVAKDVSTDPSADREDRDGDGVPDAEAPRPTHSKIRPQPDRDGDGVADVNDAFPDDSRFAEPMACRTAVAIDVRVPLEQLRRLLRGERSVEVTIELDPGDCAVDTAVVNGRRLTAASASRVPIQLTETLVVRNGVIDLSVRVSNLRGTESRERLRLSASEILRNVIGRSLAGEHVVLVLPLEFGDESTGRRWIEKGKTTPRRLDLGRLVGDATPFDLETSWWRSAESVRHDLYERSKQHFGEGAVVLDPHTVDTLVQLLSPPADSETDFARFDRRALADALGPLVRRGTFLGGRFVGGEVDQTAIYDGTLIPRARSFEGSSVTIESFGPDGLGSPTTEPVAPITRKGRGVRKTESDVLVDVEKEWARNAWKTIQDTLSR